MKILTPGRAQKGWAEEVHCTGNGNGGGGCGAVLLVEQRDLFRTRRGDYLGNGEEMATFKCIGCGVLTDLEYYPLLLADLPRARS